MEEIFIKLVEEVNSYSINGIKDKIRTKLYKEIKKLRKDDDQFSKELERLEIYLWRELLENHDTNITDLAKIYDSSNSLKFEIDRFTYLVNKE